MFTNILTALLLLITFIVAVLCNIPEYDNYILVQDDYGSVHNISLFDSLDDDELFNWSQPLDYNDEEYLADKTLKHVNPCLYINSDPDVPHTLTPATSRDAPFNIDLPTKVIIHGWLEKGDKFWLLRMKDKYLINGEYNVITVDWQYYALMDYSTAAKKTRKIGQYVGQILVSLIEAGKILSKDIHIAGHSLGSHIAGYAGKSVLAKTGEKIGRITALDPAGPLFEKPILVSKKKRLVKEDATFVDVIHTCAGLLGFKRSIGHVDFWPNSGGGVMPGCNLVTNYICSHAMSYEYYTESINTKNFVAHQCTSWKQYKRGKCKNSDKQSMGLFVGPLARGDYYLRTNKKKPYARG